MHNKNDQITVACGLSGGVDSSVAALLLKEKGYRVIGLFMKNWEEKDEAKCTTKQDYEDALMVAEKLNIPLYTVNFEKEYFDKVFKDFLKNYQKGYTPNPDVLCNKEIKFDLLLKKAEKLGAQFLATGHYAKKKEINGIFNLLKADDLSKDQSYFLYTLKSSILKKVLFPLSKLTKKEIREIAKKNDLITHNKKDSTGICFIGKRSFRPFLNQYIGYTEGNIIDINEKKVGKHKGIAFYTIGQRKGLEIGGKGDAWFVAKKEVTTNRLICVQGKKHPALYSKSLVAENITLVDENLKINTPFKCTAKVRYRQADQDCIIRKIDENKVFVEFSNPQRAITLGQSIVFYQKDICLGGGIICKIGPSLFEQKPSAQSRML